MLIRIFLQATVQLAASRWQEVMYFHFAHLFHIAFYFVHYSTVNDILPSEHTLRCMYGVDYFCC